MNKLKSLINQFLIIILYLFLVLGLQLLLHNFLEANNILQEVTYVFIDVIVLLIFIIIFRKIIFPNLKDFKKNWKKYINSSYKYYLYGLLVMAISNLIISHFIGLPSNESGNREMLFELPISSVLAIVFFAPIIEELMTRVILKDKFSNIIYYLLSGLIFASLHLIAATNVNELFYIIPYGALGYSFAVIYQKTNNVFTNIFFHSLHNLIAVLIIILL